MTRWSLRKVSLCSCRLANWLQRSSVDRPQRPWHPGRLAVGRLLTAQVPQLGNRWVCENTHKKDTIVFLEPGAFTTKGSILAARWSQSKWAETTAVQRWPSDSPPLTLFSCVSVFSPPPVTSEQPKNAEEENCAVIRTESSGRWQNRDCSIALPYVCKKRPNATLDPFTTGGPAAGAQWQNSEHDVH